MTSLTDVYHGDLRLVADRKQRALGMTLFTLGAGLVVAAIALATTNLSGWLGYEVYEARLAAGILAGVGLPTAILGIFAVMPAGGVTRALAAIGASVAFFGVVLFAHAYPDAWVSSNPMFALVAMTIYTLGTLLTFWCLFVGLATFKTRKNPGGTARLEITDEGKVRVISTSPSVPGFGSVGLFGREPDGEVATQTNESSYSTTDTEQMGGGHADRDDGLIVGQSAEPATDGTSAVTDEGGVDDDIVEAVQQRGRPDEYCGNCTHFDYVRVDGELQPYCGLHSDLLQDMDACEEWKANSEERLVGR